MNAPKVTEFDVSPKDMHYFTLNPPAAIYLRELARARFKHKDVTQVAMIITDVLNLYCPYHVLRPILRGDVWNPSIIGYYLSGTAAMEYSTLKWDTFDAACAALQALGFVMTARTTSKDPRTQAWTFAHIETADALAAAVEADRLEWQHATPCFVRYGKLPRGGRSRNHADNCLEAGVSVYRGEQLSDGRARAIPQTNQELVGRLFITDRPLYIVDGEEIGIGSDGEPLLRRCRIVREVRK